MPVRRKDWPPDHPFYRLPPLRRANVQTILRWMDFGSVTIDAIYLGQQDGTLRVIL